jgi:DNA-binding FadR family transcriptional regulator
MSQQLPLPRRGQQIRQPRVAEMIADVIRERIIDGVLVDENSRLREDDFQKEFNVGRPALREAMRILETEGLISIQRGSRGGAVARVPSTADAAYMLALVLRSRKVTFNDLARALSFVEPACASLCAGRPDRETEVIPALIANIEETRAAIEEGPKFTHLSRVFHSTIINSCGNETMRLIAGTLEEIWSSQEEEWAETVESIGEYPASKLRNESVAAHEKIVEAIQRGDEVAAGQRAQRHLDKSQPYLLSADQKAVNSDEVRIGLPQR